ncbi:hypothetical protein [Serratia sp. M24T3]|uniref:baseplate hub protein n=1 Tax=Serratia sp. M24T3 TaxID=932213 RepID=UPI00025B8F34|nr:hypothetical protein [Serratia sp. M24T3]EIC83978.1 hypothetical protein SPM24T3_13715 [Serratia sp. M24T3]
MTYKTRKIDVTISLTGGSFTSKANDNTLHIADAKIIASQNINAGMSGYTLDASIYGLSESQMSIISGSGFKYNSRPGTTIRIKVDGVIFFEGVIQWARPDYSQAPDVPLEIQVIAQPLTFNNPITDTSIAGNVTLKTVLATIAQKVGMTVGICNSSKTFNGIYLKGGAADQFAKIEEAVRGQRVFIVTDFSTVNAYIEGQAVDENTIALSTSSGLIGYPTFMEFGVFCTAIYNPKFELGKAVKLTTSVPNASGEYVITAQSAHQISSWVDNGPFFSTLLLTPKNGVASVS